MRKTNRNIKRVIFLKRIIMSFILVQSMLALLFVLLFHQSKPIDINDCQSVRITVQDKEYVRRIHNNYICQISAGDAKYEFPGLGIFGRYSSAEYYEAIEVGEQINLLYTTGYRLTGKYNLIVEAQGEDTLYLALDEYNAQKPLVAVIVFFIIVEIVFLAVIITVFLFGAKDLKLFSEKRKKCRNKANSQTE